MQEDIEAQADVPGQSIRRGYPRYSALLVRDKVFQVFRRFTGVRMRLLLAQQDKISMLEEKLEATDRSEKRQLFLSNMRLDGNEDRHRLFIDLRSALAEYDTMLEQARFVTMLPDPDDQDVKTLRDWILVTAFNREETAYLEKGSDLASLADPSDRAVKVIGGLLERFAARASRTLGHRFSLIRYKPASMFSDANVQVFILGPFMRGVSRIVTICLVSLIMLFPTLLIPKLTSLAERASASVILAAGVLVAVAVLTRARTIELVACGASYIAVMVALMAIETTTVDVRVPGVCDNMTAHVGGVP